MPPEQGSRPPRKRASLERDTVALGLHRSHGEAHAKRLPPQPWPPVHTHMCVHGRACLLLLGLQSPISSTCSLAKEASPWGNRPPPHSGPHLRPRAPPPPRSPLGSTWSPSASAGPPACSRSPAERGQGLGSPGRRGGPCTEEAGQTERAGREAPQCPHQPLLLQQVGGLLPLPAVLVLQLLEPARGPQVSAGGPQARRAAACPRPHLCSISCFMSMPCFSSSSRWAKAQSTGSAGVSAQGVRSLSWRACSGWLNRNTWLLPMMMRFPGGQRQGWPQWP